MSEVLEDKQLIHLYLKGDEKSLELLISKYLKPIYSFTYKNVGNQMEAEDITQEVFVRVWKNMRKFNQEKDFKPWIFQIAKNASIDFLRKRKKIPFTRFENDKGQNPLVDNLKATPQNLIEKLSDKGTVSAVFQTMNSEDQKILNMRHIDGMSFKEISEIFNEPINTIKSRYRRILLRARNDFKSKK